ncbi:hypothetical protein [Azospirillum himalayense]|uniref:Uncharacterized protein n=1 Tax=Azospirillum himalayense TaxID=654847 RepID=A0ABW0FYF3_9PROT
MNQHFLEKTQVVSGFVPVSMTSAQTGDYVSLKDYGRCAIVFFAAAGTAGDDPTITLTQAQDVSGTGVKALNFTRIDVKQGTLTSVGTFTTVTQAAGNTYTDATSAEVQKIWVIDVMAEDLDIANGFDCLKAAISDVGTNAQIGCMLYFMHEPRYASGTLPSAIVD